ncbi:MAG: hypothetical protein ABI467_10315 [Kofleriaceae bacterium]
MTRADATLAVLVAALVAALGACDRSTEAPPDALAGCQVELSGNVLESISSTTSCPVLVPGAGATEGDTLLDFKVASQALGGDLAIELDLGPAPTPGHYASDTTALWNAMAARSVPPGGACLYLAGNNSTPAGDFMLELATIDEDTAHGELALTLFVLPRTADDGTPTDCGPGTTEAVQLRF